MFTHRSPPYSQGIFQCIGLKEFHAYLILSPVDKASQQGQKCLNQCKSNATTRTYTFLFLPCVYLKQFFIDNPIIYLKKLIKLKILHF